MSTNHRPATATGVLRAQVGIGAMAVLFTVACTGRFDVAEPAGTVGGPASTVATTMTGDGAGPASESGSAPEDGEAENGDSTSMYDAETTSPSSGPATGGDETAGAGSQGDGAGDGRSDDAGDDGPTCKADGAACSSASECCGPYCKSGKCGCVNVGSPCGADHPLGLGCCFAYTCTCVYQGGCSWVCK